jgi:predicted metal-dependent phosphoesterase TrpH
MNNKGLTLILQAAVAAALAGCSAVATMSGPAEGFVPFARRPVEGTALCDWKGIVHCHSYLSHDSKGKVEDIAAACASCGIDFLVMTDHQTPHSVAKGKRGMLGDTLFVVGGELRTKDGVLLAFPLRHYVRPKPTTQEVVAEVHEQGALALVGHAEYFEPWQTQGLDGCEVVNLHAAARAADKGRC